MRDALLASFLQTVDPDSDEDVVLQALTLHMLQALSADWFENRRLSPLLADTLERCASVPLTLAPTASGFEVEVGVDAWYTRHLHGLPYSAPTAAEVMNKLLQLARDGEALHAWLLSEMVTRCGVSARLTFERRPFQSVPLLDAYFITHLVMLDSDYFAKPPSANAWWVPEVPKLVAWLRQEPEPDLIGEVVLCHRFLAKAGQLEPDSTLQGWLETVRPYDLHSTATLLLAHVV